MVVTAVKETNHSSSNPIDLIEQIAGAQGWIFERPADYEIAAELSGRWTDYKLFFSWLDDINAMHFACAFELTVPDYRRTAFNDLMARVNEQLAVGHFDLWAERGLPVFRHAMLLRGVSGPSVEQVEDMVEIALLESERFYPAYNYVVWGGKTPEEAFNAAMIDTIGEA
ncbi:MAG: hypothetical protein CMM53_09710 [Rhodospirillaceae bacterium]|mgnify:FL=1|nr:hypothetical protein [Rhodospirillaceae bacterium]|tara:strand:- start:371 stop:877 length:507 start_codon:yes stop_codon:yes gene_type:complete